MTATPTFRTDAHQRPDGLWVFSREEFASERFQYRPGEHVVFGGPTQRGKTTLAFELLRYVATPDCPAYVAVSKPEDPTTASWGAKLGFQRVKQWPAPRKLSTYWDGKPPGYLIWPQFGDVNTDTDRAAKVTAALIEDRYAAGVRHKSGILVMDDTMVKAKVLGLDKQMVTILAMAGAMDLGMWVFVQKPTDSGRTAIWAYGASEHLFLANDPDRKSRQRYDEIGGVESKIVAEIVQDLPPFHFLYLKRTGSQMCIVGDK